MTTSRALPAHLTARLRPYLPSTLVFVLALTTRTAIVARSAGFDALPGYDEAVYYASSSSLLHGRVPYHDFVLLHPPVVMLALLPAALLGHLTSDHTGFMAANVCFSVIGAFNAVLVSMVARRLGVRTRAAMVGGLLYALWFAPVVAEYSARLEPLGNFFLLLGLLALVSALDPARPGRRLLFATAGALLATAASTKIWFVAPLFVAVGWVLLVHRRRHDAALMALGAIAAGVLIDVPFLVASRGEMWSMVVTAQFERGGAGFPYVVRLADLTTAYSPRPHQVTAGVVLSAAVGVTVLITILMLAWRVAAARLVAGLAMSAVLTLLLGPTWFVQYADFAAAPIAVCAAVAAHALPARLRLAGWAPAFGAAGVTLAMLAQGYHAMYWWGPKALIADAREARCVTSDSPAGLIALDALDRDLQNGCDVWVDPSGRGILESHAAGPTLASNPQWQRQMVAYLRSGDLAYPYLRQYPLDPRSKAELRHHAVTRRIRAHGRTFILYWQRPCPAGCAPLRYPAVEDRGDGTMRDSTRSTH